MLWLVISGNILQVSQIISQKKKKLGIFTAEHDRIILLDEKNQEKALLWLIWLIIKCITEILHQYRNIYSEEQLYLHKNK